MAKQQWFAMNDIQQNPLKAKQRQRLKGFFKLPDMGNLARKLKNLRKWLPDYYTSAMILILIWILSGIFVVAPDELGVVKRFGRFVRTAEPGLHYHLPFPIEMIKRPKVSEVKRFEFGFRPLPPGQPSRDRTIPEEALMLTGDENIVDLRFIVQLKIERSTDFLFKVADQTKTIRDAAESTLSEIMGCNKIDAIMTDGRFDIQKEAEETLQKIFDAYESGLKVIIVQLLAAQPPEQVRDAFKDVVSAREEKNKIINEAESYSADILPKGKGLAVEIERKAEAYKEEKIKRAQGESARFLSLLREYRVARDVTRKRLYLEAMEEIAGKAQTLIIDSEKQGILPLLPIQELRRQGLDVMPKEKELR